MMRQQHVGTGLKGAVHVGFGCIERAGNAADFGFRVSNGQAYVIPALGIRLGIACQQRTFKLGDDHAAPTIESSD